LLHVDLFVGHVVPVDLELGDSGLFREDVSGETTDVGSSWWVLVHLWSIVFDVHVVSDSQELFSVLIRTSKQHCSYTDSVLFWQLVRLWRICF
jgi:predicted solute-binding protein